MRSVSVRVQDRKYEKEHAWRMLLCLYQPGGICKGLFHTISAGQPWKKFPWHTMVWHSLVQSPLKWGQALVVLCRVAQCIDKEILIGKNCDIDIGIDIDKEKFEKLIIY